MAQRVLIAPDKFKGTLTAHEAAQAIAAGWHERRPQDILDVLPMSDGGDGFGEVMSQLLGARPMVVTTCDAAHRPCKATWWWDEATGTAIIETARVIGLAMLPRGRYHPFELDSYGLGKIVQAVCDRGAARILVGLGGSATNDGGFGLARALGWQFHDRLGKPIEKWTRLCLAKTVSPPDSRKKWPKTIVGVDVKNRLLGACGATRIYGPQKGLKPSDFRLAETCLGRLVKLLKESSSADYSREPGAGAAGGLGFGFAALLRGRLEPGFELFASEVQLEKRLRRATLVITGEGAIDRSTLMGKGAGQIAKRAQQHGIPCIGIAGTLKVQSKHRRLFSQLRGLDEITSIRQALRRPAWYLERLAAKVAQEWCPDGCKVLAGLNR